MIQCCRITVRFYLEFHQFLLSQAAPPISVAPPKQAASAVGSFPLMTADSVQRYQAMFAQLDGDHDGWVQVRQLHGSYQP